MVTQSEDFYTLEEYFALELASDARHEYWDGEIVCISNGTKEHDLIVSNVYRHLSNQLKDKNCKVFTNKQAVKNHVLTSNTPPYFYPDISVVCDQPKFERINHIDMLVNPTLLVEVMSPTSKDYDKAKKLKLYQRISSLKEYLIFAQDKPQVIQYTRQNDNSWMPRISRGWQQN